MSRLTTLSGQMSRLTTLSGQMSRLITLSGQMRRLTTLSGQMSGQMRGPYSTILSPPAIKVPFAPIWSNNGQIMVK